MPTFCGFDGVARSEYEEVGYGTKGGKMFDGLVGGTVFAKADGVMSSDEDDA